MSAFGRGSGWEMGSYMRFASSPADSISVPSTSNVTRTFAMALLALIGADRSGNLAGIFSFVCLTRAVWLVHSLAPCRR